MPKKLITFDDCEEASHYISGYKHNFVPNDAIILGSGFGSFVEKLTDTTDIEYVYIPHWPGTSVDGHAGKLFLGYLEGVPVVVMQGRSHYYEGYRADQLAAPVRTFAMLGVERILVTNSAGGINPDFKPGDLMVITDHINLTGINPLIGFDESQYGPRFPDMSEAYSPKLREAIHDTALDLNLKIKSGIYAGVTGPSYETPAEVRMLSLLGADAVGMSTIPEVIAAHHMMIPIAAISCISNMAAGISKTKLNHREVQETADRVRDDFMNLIIHYIKKVNNV